MKQRLLILLYYASVVWLYSFTFFVSAIQLFVFELLGPLGLDAGWVKLLTSPLVPTAAKLEVLLYIGLHIPFGIPLLFFKPADGWLYWPMVFGNALLLAWLLQRAFQWGRQRLLHN